MTEDGVPVPPTASALATTPDGLPPAAAEIVGGEVRMFYGGPASPILELRPIPLRDVLGPAKPARPSAR